MMDILLVGTGGMGTTHYLNYLKIPRAHVCAVVGVSDADRRAAARWGLPFYGTITEAVKHHPAVMADLCVPTWLHASLAREAFSCGLHVLTEKPCALSETDAEGMFRAAAAAGKQLYVAQVLRFTLEGGILKDVVEDGRYGRPLDAVFERLSARPAWSQDGWLLDEKKSGLALFDLHIHDLDLMISVFGKPSRARIIASGENDGITDHYRIAYSWESGLTACGEAAWYTARIPFTARWRVYFEKGMLINDGSSVTGYGADGKVTAFDLTDPIQVDGGTNLPPNGWFFRELNHFIDCAQQGIPSPVVRQDQVLAVLNVIESIRG